MKRKVRPKRKAIRRPTPKLKYPIKIFYSKNDKGYIAIVPDLPQCSAWGDTYEMALKEVQIAMGCTLEVLKKDMRPIPPPTIHEE